jgi:hypothetical protein
MPVLFVWERGLMANLQPQKWLTSWEASDIVVAISS